MPWQDALSFINTIGSRGTQQKKYYTPNAHFYWLEKILKALVGLSAIVAWYRSPSWENYQTTHGN